jgi:hypothetical protein
MIHRLKYLKHLEVEFSGTHFYKDLFKRFYNGFKTESEEKRFEKELESRISEALKDCFTVNDEPEYTNEDHFPW